MAVRGFGTGDGMHSTQQTRRANFGVQIRFKGRADLMSHFGHRRQADLQTSQQAAEDQDCLLSTVLAHDMRHVAIIAGFMACGRHSLTIAHGSGSWRNDTCCVDTACCRRSLKISTRASLDFRELDKQALTSQSCCHCLPLPHALVMAENVTSWLLLGLTAGSGC